MKSPHRASERVLRSRQRLISLVEDRDLFEPLALKLAPYGIPAKKRPLVVGCRWRLRQRDVEYSAWTTLVEQ